MNDSSNRCEEQLGAEVTILQYIVRDAADLPGAPDREIGRIGTGGPEPDEYERSNAGWMSS